MSNYETTIGKYTLYAADDRLEDVNEYLRIKLIYPNDVNYETSIIFIHDNDTNGNYLLFWYCDKKEMTIKPVITKELSPLRSGSKYLHLFDIEAFNEYKNMENIWPSNLRDYNIKSTVLNEFLNKHQNEFDNYVKHVICEEMLK